VNDSGRSLDASLVGKELSAVHDCCLGRASRSFCAHSSQQTSTTCVPTVTLMALSSSLQSHAAQVFSTMEISFLSPPIGRQ
jgi:hypothetical protein